ncbi:MAG TPA: leucyl/phenylalanyl-tRNA--protein transferase [Vicinamibacterales bacterium]
MIPWLEHTDSFPPVERALREPNGLLAAGDDLSTARLLDAYTQGIFPWFNDEDPVLWWSPDPRMVLDTAGMHISRSLRKTARSGRFTVTCDMAFAEVMAGCAEPRPGQEGTWITAVMVEAYRRLADGGHAHSVEVWEQGALVGGLYGVCVGRMFYGESMFARRSDASKIALATLACQLRRWDMPMIDCQTVTAHLASLGARQMPRRAFVRDVERLTGEPGHPLPWTIDADLPAAL